MIKVHFSPGISSKPLVQPVHTPRGEPSSMHTSNLSAFPINSLPPELMCKIFKLANVPNYPAEPPECLSDVQPTKWDAIAVVSAVSRHWRTVALSEPTLWSKISVDGRFGPAILEHLKLQLARSGPSALLDIYFSTDFVAADVVKEALALLIAHVSRWKTVVLFIGLSPEHDDPLLAVIPGSATNLTEIKIDFMNWSVRLQRRVWSLFSTSPSLRGVELRAASELFIPPLLWNSLTSLKLSFFEQADVLYILQHTLALKTLWIDFSVRTLRQVAPITLPVLTELYVSVDHGHAGLLLHYLLAPSLHYLGITHGPYMAEPDEHPYLHHFLLQSQCALHSLTLHDESASEENLLIHLKSPCLRDLKHLRLYGRSQDQIVTGLTLHHDREEGELINLLPSLRSMQLWRCRTNQDGLIANLVLSRKATLVYAFVSMDSSSADSHGYRMDRAVLDGLHKDTSKCIKYRLVPKA